MNRLRCHTLLLAVTLALSACATPAPPATPATPTPLTAASTMTPAATAALAPTQTITRTPPAADLQTQIKAILRSGPPGDWGVVMENLDTGEVISLRGEDSFHPASTIKLAIGLAFFAWHEQHPGIPLSGGPEGADRSFDQLLRHMLVNSEEEATKVLSDFLYAQAGFRLQQQITDWGATHTTLEPRRSTPADLALLLRRLYRGELLSPDSTAALLEILRTPSRGDDERIGAGLPGAARASLAHKTGTVFQDGWGVVADIGVVESPAGPLVMVVLGNHIDWVDYERAMAQIARVAQAAYVYFAPPVGPTLTPVLTPTVKP